MSAQTRLASISQSLSELFQNPSTIPEQEAENLLAELDTLAFDLRFIEPALRQLNDLNSVFTLTAQLLDAAHTEKVDADHVKCFLDPIRERLELSTGEISRILS